MRVERQDEFITVVTMTNEERQAIVSALQKANIENGPTNIGTADTITLADQLSRLTPMSERGLSAKT